MKYEMTIRVKYSRQDNEWVATIKEWPNCSWLAKTKEKAALGILNVLKVGLKHGDMDCWALKPSRK